MKDVLESIHKEVISKKPIKGHVEMQAKMSSKSSNWMPVDCPRDQKQCSKAKFATDLKKQFNDDEYFSAVKPAIQTQNLSRDSLSTQVLLFI